MLDAPELQYLNEYAEYLRDVGGAAFRVAFPGAVLLGLGMVARVIERPRGWSRRTLGREGLDKLSSVASITARVWRLRKSSYGGGGAMINLGQSVDNDIVLAEYTVSTHHCSFGFDATGMVVWVLADRSCGYWLLLWIWSRLECQPRPRKAWVITFKTMG